MESHGGELVHQNIGCPEDEIVWHGISCHWIGCPEDEIVWHLISYHWKSN